MKKYVIQAREHTWSGKWVLYSGRQYTTFEEAQEAMSKFPIKEGYRIAEAYTVTRYKAVKLEGV